MDHVGGISFSLGCFTLQIVDFYPPYQVTFRGSKVMGGPVDMFLPESFSSDVLSDDLPLSLIIFPTYQTDIELKLWPLSNALAAFELMKCLANARNLSDHGLSGAVRLASLVRAFNLRYSEMVKAGRAITEILRDPSI